MTALINTIVFVLLEHFVELIITDVHNGQVHWRTRSNMNQMSMPGRCR